MAHLSNFLKRGVKVSARNHDDRPVLQTALMKGVSIEIIKELLKHGADVNAITFAGTVLGVALREEASVEIIKELLKHGADVNAKDFGGTSLKVALSYGASVEIINELLKHGADVNMTDFGGTALKFALRKGASVEIIKKLLKHGANVNVKGFKGPALEVALNEGASVEIIKELLKHGADVNVKSFGRPALEVALNEGASVEIIKELLKHGADVNVNNFGETALKVALKTGASVEIIKELLKHAKYDEVALLAASDTFHSYIEILKSSEHFQDYEKLIVSKFMIKCFLLDLNNRERLIFRGSFKCDKYDSYIDDCECEIIKMKMHIVFDNMSLFDCITKIRKGYKFSYNKIAIQLAKISYSDEFCLYNDIIIDAVKPFLVRFNLLKKLNNLSVYTKTNQDIEAINIFINLDCTYIIADFLSNDDLLNFLKAFTKYECLNQPTIKCVYTR